MGLVDSIASDEEDFEEYALFDREPREVFVDRSNVAEQMGYGVFGYAGADWGGWLECFPDWM